MYLGMSEVGADSGGGMLGGWISIAERVAQLREKSCQVTRLLSQESRKPMLGETSSADEHLLRNGWQGIDEMFEWTGQATEVVREEIMEGIET